MRAFPVCDGVVRIPLVKPDLVNVYLAEGVLIDSGGRLAQRRLLRFLRGHPISAHALTHGHLDHQGGSHAVCEEFGIPLFCGEGDREAVETGNQASLMRRPGSLMVKLMTIFAGPGHPVSSTLSDGDEIGGLRVIATPGHTPGHLAFWSEEARMIILGDVLFHRNPATLRKGLAVPFEFATYDRKSNLDSARRLAALNPDTICFGHGEPLTDGEKFQRFVDDLPMH